MMNWEQERDQAIAEKLAREPVRQLSPYVVNKPTPTGLTPNQFELFHFNEEAFPFVNRYISGLPDYLSKYFVKRYMRTFRTDGRKAANTWLRATMDKGVLSRVEGVMKRYPITVNINKPAGSVYTFGVIKGAQVLHKTIGLDEFSINDVEHFSKAFADELQEMVYQFEDKYIRNRSEPVQSEAEIDKIFTALYQKMAYYTEMKGVTPPFYGQFKKGLLNEERVNIAIEKMRSENWWHAQLLAIRSQIREHLMIAVGQVQRKASPYASREAVAEWRLIKRKSREFIKQMALIDENGDVIELAEMFYKTVSNPAIRRCELMVRMRGFEEVAKHLNYAGEFYTLTAPSCYHAVHSSGGFIKQWNFASPKETQAYLCNVFAKIRASLARKGIRPFGFRVVEPHHDGTPHWHLLLFVRQEDVQTMRDTFRRYALEVDGDEPGAAEHRFTAKAIDWDKGSATGYIAKYIAKNIDGYACDDDVDDETGESLKDMSKNVSAWAAKWRIRQFQQIGGSPVTVWRELRRKRGGVVDGDDALTQLVEAADKGDWAAYTLLQGGPTVTRDQLLARTAYEDRKPNQYGEVCKKIIGFFNQKAAELRTILTRTKVYRLIKKSLLSQDKGEQREALENSDQRSPWSSVNNCTGQKINNVNEFLKYHAEEVKNLRFSLELRHIPSRWITDYRLCRLIQGHSVDITAGYSICWNGYEVEIRENC